MARTYSFVWSVTPMPVSEETYWFQCKKCGERFDREVWHCKKCHHHWLLHREECWNCHAENRPSWATKRFNASQSNEAETK